MRSLVVFSVQVFVVLSVVQVVSGIIPFPSRHLIILNSHCRPDLSGLCWCVRNKEIMATVCKWETFVSPCPPLHLLSKWTIEYAGPTDARIYKEGIQVLWRARNRMPRCHLFFLSFLFFCIPASVVPRYSFHKLLYERNFFFFVFLFLFCSFWFGEKRKWKKKNEKIVNRPKILQDFPVRLQNPRGQNLY